MSWSHRGGVLLLFVSTFVPGCGEGDPELWVSAQSLQIQFGIRSAQFVITNVGGGTMEGRIDSTMLDLSANRFTLAPGDDQVVTSTLKAAVVESGLATVDGQILVSAGIAGHATIRVSARLVPPEEEPAPADGPDPVDPNRADILWETETFAEQVGAAPQIFNPPYDDTDANGHVFRMTEAYGDAFVGTPNNAGDDGSLKYLIRVPSAGDWYFWGRAIGPPTGDNSFYWGIDVDDKDAVRDNAAVNIWDFNEAAGLSINFPLGDPAPDEALHSWTWYRLSSREGPFPGFGSYDNPTPVALSAGEHTFHLIVREDGAYMDALYATKSASFDANEVAPR